MAPPLKFSITCRAAIVKFWDRGALCWKAWRGTDRPARPEVLFALGVAGTTSANCPIEGRLDSDRYANVESMTFQRSKHGPLGGVTDGYS